MGRLVRAFGIQMGVPAQISDQVKNEFANFVVPSIKLDSLSTVVQVSAGMVMYVVLQATDL